MSTLSIEPSSTALVLIDLQKGIVARQTEPHSPADVVSRGRELADALRKAGGTVAFVHVRFSKDERDRLTPESDEKPPSGPMPAGFSDLVPELGVTPGDLIIAKQQWGAFYDTGLELQLRRRGIRTIVLGGISTNFGVESTARDAWERGFRQIFVEDAMAAFTTKAHEFAVKTIFPRLGLVRSTAEVLAAIPGR